jgi:hypothetical protein
MTATLDQIKVGDNLVSAIDGHIQNSNLGQSHERDTFLNAV